MRNGLINWCCAIVVLTLIIATPPNGYRGYLIFQKPSPIIQSDSSGEAVIRTSFPNLTTCLRELASQRFWNDFLLPRLDADTRKRISRQHHRVRFRITKIDHEGERRFAIEVLIPYGGEALFDTLVATYRDCYSRIYDSSSQFAREELELLQRQAVDTLAILESSGDRPPNFESEQAWLKHRIERLRQELKFAERRAVEEPFHFPFEPCKPPRQWCFTCR